MSLHQGVFGLTPVWRFLIFIVQQTHMYNLQADLELHLLSWFIFKTKLDLEVECHDRNIPLQCAIVLQYSYFHSLSLAYVYSTYPVLSTFLPLLFIPFTSSNFLFKSVLFTIPEICCKARAIGYSLILAHKFCSSCLKKGIYLLQLIPVLSHQVLPFL